jgi:TP901 family phage tail tape measure protein
MDSAILQLNKRLGDFVIDGTGPAKKAFEELGLAAKIQSGELSGVEDVLDAVVKGLVGIQDPARQASLMADLFGREAGPRWLHSWPKVSTASRS